MEERRGRENMARDRGASSMSERKTLWLVTAEDGRGIYDYELARTPVEAREMASSWRGDTRKIVIYRMEPEEISEQSWRTRRFVPVEES